MLSFQIDFFHVVMLKFLPCLFLIDLYIYLKIKTDNSHFLISVFSLCYCIISVMLELGSLIFLMNFIYHVFYFPTITYNNISPDLEIRYCI